MFMYVYRSVSGEPADLVLVFLCTPLVPLCNLFRDATIHNSFLRRPAAAARQHLETVDGYMSMRLTCSINLLLGR